jgi:hypothetical protein
MVGVIVALRAHSHKPRRAGYTVNTPDHRDQRSPPKRKDAASPSVNRAAEHLFEQLEELSDAASLVDRVSCLEEFRRNGGGLDIGKALMPLGRERARTVREKLRPPRDGQFRIRLEDASWETPSLQRALAHARDTGLAMISCEVEERILPDAQKVFAALYAGCPEQLTVYQLQQARYPVGEKNLGRIESLLVKIEAT